MNARSVAVVCVAGALCSDIATAQGEGLQRVVVTCVDAHGKPVTDAEVYVFQYRTGVMEAVAYKVAQLRAMAMGEIPVNQDLFIKHANDVATLATMIPEGFIPNSAIEGSAALPEIWTNNADFQAKAMDLHNAAQSLAMAAQSQGFEAAKGMVQQVGGTCGGCHRPYRRRQE